MVLFAMCLLAPLGWGLGWLRGRLGPSGMLSLAPALWCGWEMVRTWTPIGNPWFSLGHAFWKLTPLIQIADLGSYYLHQLRDLHLYLGGSGQTAAPRPAGHPAACPGHGAAAAQCG